MMKEQASSIADDDKEFVFDLILKAYEHHKIHARFQETQRSWMVTAYLTLTGFLFAGMFSGYFKESRYEINNFEFVILPLHFFIGLFFLVAVAKLSGEFRRHFYKAEGIILHILSHYEKQSGAELDTIGLLDKCPLSTAEHQKTDSRDKPTGTQSTWIAIFSNAAIHGYMFSMILALDTYMILSLSSKAPLLARSVGLGVFFFFGILQYLYIHRIANKI